VLPFFWFCLLIHLCLAEPSDKIKMARVAGRMTGRAVGRLMLYRRQMDDIFEQTAAKKVPPRVCAYRQHCVIWFLLALSVFVKQIHTFLILIPPIPDQAISLFSIAF
jgi:hypothetical protein